MTEPTPKEAHSKNFGPLTRDSLFNAAHTIGNEQNTGHGIIYKSHADETAMKFTDANGKEVEYLVGTKATPNGVGDHQIRARSIPDRKTLLSIDIK